MGEMQGNLWATMIFIIAFTSLSTLIVYIVGVMEYSAQVEVIEDSFASGNMDYYKTLPKKFKPCPSEPTSTYDNCTGIVEINEEEGFILFQVSYDGFTYKRDASGINDYIVMLPY